LNWKKCRINWASIKWIISLASIPRSTIPLLDLQLLESINRKLAAHIGKYDGIFARLCVIWHCVESEPGNLRSTISEQTARRVGAFLHGFLLPHAITFYAGVLGLSNDHDRLTAVAGYILRYFERFWLR
jgi:hypothetical protein